MSLSKACVVLGAGESCDVAGEGSPIIKRDFQPPLALDLFDINGHPAYWDVMQHYDGAAILSQDLAPLILSGEISIEKELRRYAEHRDQRIRQHFKHIPAYLRDLLFRASREYTHVPSSYVRLIIKLMAENPHDVLFLVLNYDNLLESALRRFDSNLQFTQIEQYVASNREAKVVKLHGSIGWFRRLPGGTAADWNSAVADLDISKLLTEEAILIKDGIRIVRDSVEDDHRLYPILTAPLAGKGLIDVVCPQSHVATAQQFMNDCDKFLIIGSSGLDEDLLALLDSAVIPKSRPIVHVVDKDGRAEKTWAHFEEGVRAFRKARQNPSERIFNGGFRNYLSSQQLRVFLESE
jgi:hypothetical protein